ncbi:demethylmenaquinone methyltransferase/2-methoxy-6-polyprenyl-1,4-benzoquinol methylase [Allocatelliglobosispora scoriae]|uniref:Demethylmenaquinone methyltransferase n=1 Tax=Allocatelliglobosispora scoriae TaxID=643052 RepID=A0A841BUA8_9ACTN|nr:demethylmenaquinone methyltransferase [Allocatelliglobosispora scoriae]MBB5871275.1 demethylmenaquinone methyltransferase/2-methoxy-6-polyprenyl-1,4-benzoquinol methylase [Allocatelliglobosispora scoriae]
MSRANLDKQPHEIAEMFDGVAANYDRTNTILSFGRDRAWRKATAAALALKPGEKVLDLGAGTGVSTVDLARGGAFAVGSDLSLGMLGVGRRVRPEVPLVAGDALALPFADGVFDAVTISFALRNVVDTAGALREMARVTKPGGRLVVCEFSHPTWGAFRKAYLTYLMGSLPAVARRVSSNPDAYVYLAESIRAWPDQAGLSEIMQGAGWSKVGWRNLTGGIVALHRAIR